MNIEINDIIKFRNNDYLVLDVIKKNDSTYVYLINNSEFEDDIAISKIVNDSFTYIDNEEEFIYVLNKLFLDFKENIIDIATNE